MARERNRPHQREMPSCHLCSANCRRVNRRASAACEARGRGFHPEHVPTFNCSPQGWCDFCLRRIAGG
eukprot:15459435-Alexandrium_andersonii.AAC.1